MLFEPGDISSRLYWIDFLFVVNTIVRCFWSLTTVDFLRCELQLKLDLRDVTPAANSDGVLLFLMLRLLATIPFGEVTYLIAAEIPDLVLPTDMVVDFSLLLLAVFDVTFEFFYGKRLRVLSGGLLPAGVILVVYEVI